MKIDGARCLLSRLLRKVTITNTRRTIEKVTITNTKVGLLKVTITNTKGGTIESDDDRVTVTFNSATSRISDSHFQ